MKKSLSFDMNDKNDRKTRFYFYHGCEWKCLTSNNYTNNYKKCEIPLEKWIVGKNDEYVLNRIGYPKELVDNPEEAPEFHSLYSLMKNSEHITDIYAYKKTLLQTTENEKIIFHSADISFEDMKKKIIEYLKINIKETIYFDEITHLYPLKFCF